MVVKPHPVAMIQAPSGVYLSVIQFYLLNHTQNVISGRNTRVKLHWNLVWDSQHWPVYGIASGRTSGWVLCSKHIASIPCQAKWPVYRGGRTSESRNSESLLYIYILYILYYASMTSLYSQLYLYKFNSMWSAPPPHTHTCTLTHAR